MRLYEVTKPLNEGRDGWYYRFEDAVEVWIKKPKGNNRPVGGMWMGGEDYKMHIAAPGDELHYIPGGLFYVPQEQTGGVPAYLYDPTRARFQNANQDIIKEYIDNDILFQLHTPHLAQVYNT